MRKNKAKILLVEDNPALQVVFTRQLNRLGYVITSVADNGLIAVKKSNEQLYDLIFMDVRLPGMDGIIATQQIRAAEITNGQRSVIVGLTAFAERARCLEAGMDDYLQKPVLLEQLDQILDKWVLSVAENENSSELWAPYQPGSVRNLDPGIRLTLIQQKIAKLRARVGLD